MEQPNKLIKTQNIPTKSTPERVIRFYGFCMSFNPEKQDIIWGARAALKLFRKHGEKVLENCKTLTFAKIRSTARGKIDLKRETLEEMRNLVSRWISEGNRFFDEDFTLRLPKEILGIILTSSWEYGSRIKLVCKRWNETLNRPENKSILLKKLTMKPPSEYIDRLRVALILHGLKQGYYEEVTVEMTIENHIYDPETGEEFPEEKEIETWIYCSPGHENLPSKYYLAIEIDNEEDMDCWLGVDHDSNIGTSYRPGTFEKIYEMEEPLMKGILRDSVARDDAFDVEIRSEQDVPEIWNKIYKNNDLFELVENNEEIHRELVNMVGKEM